jgi:uncharacterized HAD superfamily protein
MGKKFGRLICIPLLLIFLSAAARAQPYKRLTVDDFRGIPGPANSVVVAKTNCTIEYRYSARPENDYYILNFTITLTMNRDRSWMDRRRLPNAAAVAEILKHEQGHYDISYMEQQELLRTVSHTVFRDDYQQAANAIFERIDAKYKQLNLDYDNDTQNSVNRVQQHSWDVYFARTLRSLLGDNYYAAAAR